MWSKIYIKRIALFLSAIFVFTFCGINKKIKNIESKNLTIGVKLPSEDESNVALEQDEIKTNTPPDTFSIKGLEGTYMFINVTKDEKTGEQIMTDKLDAVVIEAKFRNVAERMGKVDIGFEVQVPAKLIDPNWQIRFQPSFLIHNDTLYSEQVHITGDKFREAQLKGYELYNSYLSGIIPDSSDFVKSFTYEKLLRIFVERRSDKNELDLSDTTAVNEIVDYYTKYWLVNRNEKRKERAHDKFKRFVKTPIVTERVRLDSIVKSDNGAVKYYYVQTLNATKELKKVDMVLNGDIISFERELYTLPETAPITFYISSISSLTESDPKYITKVISRNLNLNTLANIKFNKGEWMVDANLPENISEISRIKENMRSVILEDNYIVDSLKITASCSPEGIYRDNINLAKNRAASIRGYFSNYISHLQDSLNDNKLAWSVDYESNKRVRVNENYVKNKNIEFLIDWVPEEWRQLEHLIVFDSLITDKEYLLTSFEEIDLDKRERLLQKSRDYDYIHNELYPHLRSVKFDFYLHRKDMVKDTIHTTVLDTLYMSGVEALNDRDYKKAINKLKTYKDYNTAIAYLCLEYNKSALEILKSLPPSAKRDYLISLVYARENNEEASMEYYIKACERDPSMRFRGNLDPEISKLIRKYNITNINN